MKNKALLVGINKYPDPRNELRGCVNDILEMEHFIAETNKVYFKQNIKKLTNKDATKKGIITNLKWLIEGAEPGDQLLFHYSGHGAQAPTKFTSLENFQKLKEKDIIVMCDVGAYGMSLSSNYNLRPKPTELLIKGSKINVIKKRQKHKDLM